MKSMLSLLATIVGFAVVSITTPVPAAGLPNPFYAMDTAFAPHFRKNAPPLDQGFQLVKELGYAGVAWIEKAPNAVKRDLTAIEKHGLKMFAIYCPAKATPEGDVTLSPNTVPVMEVLKGHCEIIWIHIAGSGPAIGKLTGKEPAVAKLRALADTAKANGLKIAIYPHVGEWTARFGDATRLAKLVNHPNFGVSFNLCHGLVVGDEAQIPALLADARSVLVTATICGADTGIRGSDKDHWKKAIQPLGQGTYDVTIVLKKLHELGFSGPIGFQGCGIAQEPREILTTTMDAWKKLSAAAAAAK